MPIVPTLLVVATILGAGMIVPQVLRVRRTGSLAGVSLGWVGLGAALNGWWVAYGVAADVWGVVPVSAGGLVLYLCIMRLAIRIVGPGVVRPALAGAAVPTLVASATLAVAGWTATGLVLGLAYGVQFAPAVVSAWRSERVDGVSPTTWSMAWGEAVIWLVYGLDVGDAPLVLGGGGGAVMATAILVRLTIVARTRRRGVGQARPVAT